MTKEERELLIFLSTFVRTQRAYAVTEKNGELIGTAAAEVRKFDHLVDAVRRQAESA
ncbi:hypothetical protein [Azospirillum sp. ST 5-10]|uniref:hypothetical protein n=1 Tax=unclassified Azospirillum TaxID=2630922 RepID=UPI003F49F106